MKKKSVQLNYSTAEYLRSRLLENLAYGSAFKITDKGDDYIKTKFGRWFNFTENKRGKAIVKFNKERGEINIEISYRATIVVEVISYSIVTLFGFFFALSHPVGWLIILLIVSLAVWDYKRFKDTTEHKFNQLQYIIEEINLVSQNDNKPEIPPPPDLEEKKPVPKPAPNKDWVREELESLEREESMIDSREVRNALEESDLNRAKEALEQLKEKYSEYNEAIEKLETLDDRESALATQLADKEINRDTYNDAIKSIEHKKAELEEKVNRLRKEVIYEDYEKPF